MSKRQLRVRGKRILTPGATSPQYFMVFCLLCLSLSQLASEDLWEQATRLERSGDLAGARVMYMAWLDEQSGSVEASDALIHTASLHENAADAVDLLKKYVRRLPPHASYPVWAKLASLESAMGLPSDAAAHYMIASTMGGSTGELWHLRALSLLFSTGELPAVRREAGRLSLSASTQFVRDEAAALFAITLAALESPYAALHEIDGYIAKAGAIESPLIWLALAKISGAAGNRQQNQRAHRSIEIEFPGSSVHLIAASRISEWVSPGNFIDLPLYSGVKWVQVGAFSIRENAANLRYKLESAGFIAWIEQEGDLWRVFVNDADGKAKERLIDFQASL